MASLCLYARNYLRNTKVGFQVHLCKSFVGTIEDQRSEVVQERAKILKLGRNGFAPNRAPEFNLPVHMPVQKLYCGVVVTFEANAAVITNIREMCRECGSVIVVDNGSTEELLARIANIDGADLIRSSKNVGLAAALNIGLSRARTMGYQWAITFDQDSTPEHGLAHALWATHLKYPQAAIVVPRILETAVELSETRWPRKSSAFPLCFERVSCNGVDLSDVMVAITSGSLTELAIWADLGGFEDSLFIDYIDVDYCLRVRKEGRSIVVSAAAALKHQLGERESRILMGHDFRPTFHSALRHYYIARNRVFVWRRHALNEPHWALFDICSGVYNLFRVVFLENRVQKKLKAIVLGTIDGLKKRSGPAPVGRI